MIAIGLQGSDAVLEDFVHLCGAFLNELVEPAQSLIGLVALFLKGAQAAPSLPLPLPPFGWPARLALP